MLTKPTIILVTNCTATKKITAGEPILLRNWSGSVSRRFHSWRLAIDKANSVITARDCYGGDSWSQSVAALNVDPDKNQLWVLSAGLGLITANHKIPNYSATFVSNDIDSVASDKLGKSEWWNMLVGWRRESQGIGCITDLAVANPQSVLIVAVSSSYFSIIENDLVSARAALISPDNLLVISAGTRRLTALGKSLLPIDARFENIVGGARATLNARMLRHIIEKYKSQVIDASRISDYLSSLAENLSDLRTYERIALNDDQIGAFIRKQLELIPKSSASAFLRLLRDSGASCEQKRFQRIYKNIHQI